MKRSIFLSACVLALSLSCSKLAIGDDYGYRPGPAPARGLFGIPMPQQWAGIRPIGYSNGYSSRSRCPNGQCGPSSCPNGNCSTSACANGECSTRSCPNGQCNLGDGVRQGSSCPNGNCNINSMTGRTMRSPSTGVQNDWSPRTTRGLADPYRRAGSMNDDSGWSQRTLRPVLDPVNDAFGSRYSRDNMDLNSDYFRGGDDLDRTDSGYRPSSRRQNGPSDRSLEAPLPTSRSTRI